MLIVKLLSPVRCGSNCKTIIVNSLHRIITWDTPSFSVKFLPVECHRTSLMRSRAHVGHFKNGVLDAYGAHCKHNYSRYSYFCPPSAKTCLFCWWDGSIVSAEKETLDQVTLITWANVDSDLCCQLPYGITKPQWVNFRSCIIIFVLPQLNISPRHSTLCSAMFQNDWTIRTDATEEQLFFYIYISFYLGYICHIVTIPGY